MSSQSAISNPEGTFSQQSSIPGSHSPAPSSPRKKIKVAVLGATGAVCQRFVQLLEDHPWFEVTALTGSDRTIGQTYGEGCRWILPEPMPRYVRDMRVVPTAPGFEAAIAFSALPTDTAKDAEPALAAAGYGVCSNASS